MKTNADTMPSLPAPGTGRAVSVIATGSYLPDRVLSNADLEKMVETSDEWIVSRTGIRERRIALPGQATSDLGLEASRRALAQAGIAAEEIEMIIVATITPDMFFPSTACLIQHALGAKNAFCFDMEAACSGYLYAIEIAHRFVASGTVNTALVIAAEKMSSIVDWKDRSTCVLFGDGAGAAVLRSRPGERGILSSVLGADGSLSHLLTLPGGGSRHPPTQQTISDGLHTLKMAGREVFKHAVNTMSSAATEALRRAGLTVADVACMIPHQANQRIISAIAEKLGVPDAKCFVNIDKCGNMSAASLAVGLDQAVRTGRIRKKDIVLMVVFGGGFTWGATVIEW